MRKLVSILFLVMFLFNVGGYYLVLWGVRTQANHDLLKRLDAEQYSSSDLIVLTLPVSLPYPIQQNGYERVDGEFEYNGEYYNLVKQRLENDTLFMVCIKDHREKKLVNAFTEYANMANNLPANAKHTMDLFGKLFKDYTAPYGTMKSSDQGWTLALHFPHYRYDLLDASYRIATPPPQA